MLKFNLKNQWLQEVSEYGKFSYYYVIYNYFTDFGGNLRGRNCSGWHSAVQKKVCKSTYMRF